MWYRHPNSHDERYPQRRARALHHHIRWDLDDNVEWKEDGESVLSTVNWCSKDGSTALKDLWNDSLTLYCKPFIPRSPSRPAKRALPMLVLNDRKHTCTVVVPGIAVAGLTTRRTGRGSSIDTATLGMGSDGCPSSLVAASWLSCRKRHDPRQSARAQTARLPTSSEYR
jgi:hypothetical protein